MNNNPSKINVKLIQEIRSMIARLIHGNMDWLSLNLLAELPSNTY